MQTAFQMCPLFWFHSVGCFTIPICVNSNGSFAHMFTIDCPLASKKHDFPWCMRFVQRNYHQFNHSLSILISNDVEKHCANN